MDKIQALELSAGLANLVTGMETDLLNNIAAYMLSGKTESEASKWKIRKLAELGKLNKKNLETLNSYIKPEKEMAAVTLQRAVVDAMTTAEEGFAKMVADGLVSNAPAGSMDKTMQNVLKSIGKQAKDDLNIVNTTMLMKAKDAAGKAIREAAELANKQEFIDLISKAAGKTITGTDSITSAVSCCLKEMADKGLPGFVDKSGREWSPEAYVNMCVRSTVKSTETKALFDRMEDYGEHILEISSHSGARPKCAKDQGKLFDLNNGSGYIEDLNGKKIRYYPWSSSSHGKPDGLFGINCGHHGSPFTAGISTQTYFPYDEEENSAQYQKLQKQRELERKVRASKRECSMLKDGDKEMFADASVKLKERQNALKDYCTANDLTYQNERTNVLGYGHSEAGKVTAAYRKKIEEDKLKLKLFDIDNCTENDIINMKGRLSDREARKWYLNQDKKIPDLIDKSAPLEEQAKQCCELRNKFRTQARDLMKDQEKRKELDITDPNKSYEELLADKMRRKKMTKEQAIKDVIKTATKTRKSVNKDFGLE